MTYTHLVRECPRGAPTGHDRPPCREDRLSQSLAAIRARKRRTAERLKRLQLETPNKSGKFECHKTIWDFVVHPLDDERFEVIDGTLRLTISLCRKQAHPRKIDQSFTLCRWQAPDPNDKNAEAEDVWTDRFADVGLAITRAETAMKGAIKAEVLERAPSTRPGKGFAEAPSYFRFTEKFKKTIRSIPREFVYGKSAVNTPSYSNILGVPQPRSRKDAIASVGTTFVRERIIIQPSGTAEDTVRQIGGELGGACQGLHALVSGKAHGLDPEKIKQWQHDTEIVARALASLPVKDVLAGSPETRLAIECAALALDRLKGLLPPTHAPQEPGPTQTATETRAPIRTDLHDAPDRPALSSCATTSSSEAPATKRQPLPLWTLIPTPVLPPSPPQADAAAAAGMQLSAGAVAGRGKQQLPSPSCAHRYLRPDERTFVKVSKEPIESTPQVRDRIYRHRERRDDCKPAFSNF